MRSSKQQTKIFLFGLLLMFLGSLSVNLYFLKDTEKPQQIKDALKVKFHATEVEKFIQENPEVYAYFKDKDFKSHTEQINFIREWIFNNSIGEGDTNYVNAFNTPKVIEDLFLASEKQEKKPALTCGPRAFAMEQILMMLGYQTRFVSIYFVNYYPDQIGSHSYVEVFNPDTKHWEINDPLNNIYYIDSSGRKLNTLEISYMHPNDFKPCKNNQVCGNGVLTDDISRFPESFKLISFKEYGEDFVIFLNSKYYTSEKYYKKDDATIESFFKDKKYVFVF